MAAPLPPLTREHFAALAAHAGLRLTPAQLAEIFTAWPSIEATTERVRPQRDRSAEPSHIFAAGGGTDPSRGTSS